MFIKKQHFYEMKVITMFETYEELVEIKHNLNRPYISDVLLNLKKH